MKMRRERITTEVAEIEHRGHGEMGGGEGKAK
jgi:hypothetical protein